MAETAKKLTKQRWDSLDCETDRILDQIDGLKEILANLEAEMSGIEKEWISVFGCSCELIGIPCNGHKKRVWAPPEE